jgi:hypothetical protein
MAKRFAVSTFIAFVMLGAPSLAMAGDNDKDDRGGRRAPEPITVLGLALGAGGIAAARWAKGRFPRDKK